MIHKIAVVSVLSLANHAFAQDPAEAGHSKPTKDIVATAVGAGQFDTLVAAVKAAGLVETLQGKGPFTVFAPNDAAFAKLGKDTIAKLLLPESKQKLASILTYHVVAGKVTASEVVKLKQVATVEGSSLAVSASKDSVQIGTAKVLSTDIMTTNGVIHVIDTVLLPPEGPGNLVAVAEGAGSFKTLIAAATAAGLGDTLANGGPFTVFAPTDEAFAKLGKDAIADLLKPENKAKLANILKYHVVAGTVKAADVVKLKNAETLQGGKVTIAVEGGKVKLDGANVVKTDVMASNGVIHVIDAVILPR